LDLPITKTKIKFRPFLVKEEKVLLIAQESGKTRDLINALIQIVNNCIFDDMDVEDLPMVELEYIFLQLRSKSVNNIQKIVLTDTEDDQKYTFEINLDEVELIQKEVDNKVQLTDDVGIIMKTPSVKKMVSVASNTNDADTTLEVFKACIDKIYDSEDVYEVSDHSKEELDQFVEQLTSEQFQQVTNFFQSIPKLQYTIEYENSIGNKRQYVLEGLADFFQ